MRITESEITRLVNLIKEESMDTKSFTFKLYKINFTMIVNGSEFKIMAPHSAHPEFEDEVASGEIKKGIPYIGTSKREISYFLDDIQKKIKTWYNKEFKELKEIKLPNDLSKMKNFKKIHRGAEFYSMSDDKDRQADADRWYELMFKHQKGNKLTGNEAKEFYDLSMSLMMEDI